MFHFFLDFFLSYFWIFRILLFSVLSSFWKRGWALNCILWWWTFPSGLIVQVVTSNNDALQFSRPSSWNFSSFIWSWRTKKAQLGMHGALRIMVQWWPCAVFLPHDRGYSWGLIWLLQAWNMHLFSWESTRSHKETFSTCCHYSVVKIISDFWALIITSLPPVPPDQAVKPLKSVQSALSDLKRPPERLQSQCNYRPFIT